MYDILKTGREHLYLLSSFLTYAYKRVRMSPNDFIVNQNRNERASTILSQAAIATLHEIDQVEYHISQLLSLIRKVIENFIIYFPVSINIYFYVHYNFQADKKQHNVGTCLLAVGGLGISLALLYRWRYY